MKLIVATTALMTTMAMAPLTALDNEPAERLDEAAAVLSEVMGWATQVPVLWVALAFGVSAAIGWFAEGNDEAMRRRLESANRALVHASSRRLTLGHTPIAPGRSSPINTGAAAPFIGSHSSSRAFTAERAYLHSRGGEAWPTATARR